MEQTIIVAPPTDNHVYDYDNPKIIDEYTVHFLCINADKGCKAYISHSHDYEAIGPKRTTDEYEKTPGDSFYHVRKYVEPQRCKDAICKMLIEDETWKDEHHTWRIVETVPATCLEHGYEKNICDFCGRGDEFLLLAPGYHDYDYEHPSIINDHVVQYYCKAE